MRQALLFACFSIPLGSAAFPDAAKGQARNGSAHDEASVRAFLQDRLRESRANHPATRYALAWADLNGDGRNEAIVRIMSGGYCGTGGCSMYVLSPYRRRWSMVGRITITKPPIRMLNSRTHGWRNLGVRQSGCCDAYEALLPFDGRTYPTNPSVAPARRLRRAVPGRVLISQRDEGRLLFR